MSKSRWILVLLFCLLLPFAIGGEGTNQPRHRLRVSLQNGSRVVGTSALSSLNVDLGFKTLEIPLQRIQRVDRTTHARGGRHRLFFKNGDVLTGTLQEKSIELDATFDKLSMPMEMITKIEILSQGSESLVQEGLLLHLPFDNDENGEVQNLSSADLDMRATGIRFEADDQRGRVALFGDRCQIKIAHNKTLCPKNLTMGGWLYATQNASGYQVVAAKSQPSSWHGGYGLYCLSENIVFFVNGYSSTYVQTKLPLNRWSHIIAVCNDNFIQLYIDGELVQQRPIQPVATGMGRDPAKMSGITQHVDTPLVLGSDTNYPSWQGKLDDFVLFDRALSAAEIHLLCEGSR